MGPVVAVRHTPVIRMFYQRLRAVGKPAQGALTACMRTLLTLLNAILNHQTPLACRSVVIGLRGKIVLDF
jgi:transposase